MNETNERSVASSGSQPVAWMVEWTDHADFFLHKPDAEMVAAGDMAVQSLYRQPQPALTDEEREGIEGIIRDFQVIAEFNEERCHPHYAQKARCRAAMLSGLLKRLG